MLYTRQYCTWFLLLLAVTMIGKGLIDNQLIRIIGSIVRIIGRFSETRGIE